VTAFQAASALPASRKPRQGGGTEVELEANLAAPDHCNIGIGIGTTDSVRRVMHY
jgi:hypothetical protein